MPILINMKWFLFFCAAVSFGFLIYSLINRDNLGIPLHHPRILVEFGFFITFLITGVLIK
ncbi:MAG: hypothetical protein D6B26_04460 [Spirochaetaceae bacterium]|nr:MAG: hypothetical protein D6B26_04460 [Spirochaetaceae bacterium]